MFDPNQPADKKITTPTKIVSEVPNFEVRTMPAKFLSIRPSIGSSGSNTGFKKNILVGLLIVVLVGGAMAAAAFLFLKSVRKDKPLPQPSVNTTPPETNLVQEPLILETPTTTDLTLLTEALRDINAWQTYEGDPYDYAFKYPSVWSTSITNQTSSSDYAKQVLVFGETDGKVEISIYNIVESETLLSWLSSTLGLSEIDLESYQLNNNNAYRHDDVAGDTFSIFSLYGNNIYQLRFYKSDKNIINEAYNQFIINWEFTPLLEEETDEEVVYEPAVDSDADGLTDTEESLYGSGANNPDTDGDTYKDGAELINLYNPIVAGSAKIFDSDLVKTYVNNSGRYNLVYPSSWEIKETPGTTIFQSATGEFVQVSVDPNSGGYQDIKSWYTNYLELDSDSVSDITISSSEAAILSTDKMRVYFLLGDNIYSIIYNIALRKDGNFMSTFSMMLKSFKIMKTE